MKVLCSLYQYFSKTHDVDTPLKVDDVKKVVGSVGPSSPVSSNQLNPIANKSGSFSLLLVSMKSAVCRLHTLILLLNDETRLVFCVSDNRNVCILAECWSFAVLNDGRVHFLCAH